MREEGKCVFDDYRNCCEIVEILRCSNGMSLFNPLIPNPMRSLENGTRIHDPQLGLAHVYSMPINGPDKYHKFPCSNWCEIPVNPQIHTQSRILCNVGTTVHKKVMDDKQSSPLEFSVIRSVVLLYKIDCRWFAVPQCTPHYHLLCEEGVCKYTTP